MEEKRKTELTSDSLKNETKTVFGGRLGSQIRQLFRHRPPLGLEAGDFMDASP